VANELAVGLVFFGTIALAAVLLWLANKGLRWLMSDFDPD
jgi:uncharacterized membrane protein YjgN (DUF898 family)